MGLQKFEQSLERLVEGVFAKAFRTGLQPVEIGRRLVREMDLNRTLGVRGTIVPNEFTILLGPADRERFAPLEQTLITELIDTAREHARDQGYRFVGVVSVALDTDPTLGTGTFRLDAEVVEGAAGASVVLPDGTRFTIGEQVMTVGRAPECDIVLSDPTVSKRHLELQRRGTAVTLTDLGSTNGTKVNDHRVHEMVLTDGDTIRLGATVLRFEAL
jgi:hypothetical protein